MWRLTWWQAALLAAVAIAAVLAIAIVATSLILIIAPIVLIAVLVHRFLSRRRMPPGHDGRPGRPTVIDAEYEVIPAERSADRRWPDADRGSSRPE
jgi:membrane protein implicated in regulation of membrane protease activity